MNPPDIYWSGESGRKYGYWIHPIEAQFRKTAGNIISPGKLKRENGFLFTSDKPGILMKD
ncbi:MAG: hypothetical protein L0956_04160 [Candidatus Mariimomonas ferrooxydans]